MFVNKTLNQVLHTCYMCLRGFKSACWLIYHQLAPVLPQLSWPTLNPPATAGCHCRAARLCCSKRETKCLRFKDERGCATQPRSSITEEIWHFSRRAVFTLWRPQTLCSFNSAHYALSMHCYTLTAFNFHCPNKVYVKESQSNKSETHQGDKCLSSWLGVCEDFFFFRCSWWLDKPEIPLPLWHKDT